MILKIRRIYTIINYLSMIYNQILKKKFMAAWLKNSHYNRNESDNLAPICM
jgi:hypothetical protein